MSGGGYQRSSVVGGAPSDVSVSDAESAGATHKNRMQVLAHSIVVHIHLYMYMYMIYALIYTTQFVLQCVCKMYTHIHVHVYTCTCKICSIHVACEGATSTILRTCTCT